jgi:hypothetical protein
VSFWTAVVVIVAIIAIALIRIEKYRALGRRRREELGSSERPAAELERELVELKKRMAVLERIATDDRQSRAIAQEIEALRDR